MNVKNISHCRNADWLKYCRDVLDPVVNNRGLLPSGEYLKLHLSMVLIPGIGVEGNEILPPESG